MSVFKKGNKKKGPDLRYLVLDPIIGELAIFETEKYFLQNNQSKSDIVKLSMILAVMHGF